MLLDSWATLPAPTATAGAGDAAADVVGAATTAVPSDAGALAYGTEPLLRNADVLCAASTSAPAPAPAAALLGAVPPGWAPQSHDVATADDDAPAYDGAPAELLTIAPLEPGASSAAAILVAVADAVAEAAAGTAEGGGADVPGVCAKTSVDGDTCAAPGAASEDAAAADGAVPLFCAELVAVSGEDA